MTITPTPIPLEHIRQVRREADCLCSKADVDAAFDRMANAITARYRDSNPLLICIMTGGVIATSELMLRLDFPLELDYLHASRYRGATTGGDIQWLVEPRHALKDRVLLIIDDILDEGHTLAAIVEHCRAAGARSVETAVLVEKLHTRKHGIQADYVGLQVEDRYVFGYGMDYKGYLRNAPGIFAVKGQ